MINFMLDPKTGAPFYRQIIDQIKFGIAIRQADSRGAIANGEFPGGGT